MRRGLFAATLILCAMLGGCGSHDYAGISLTPGAAPADLQALAGRARSGDKQAQFDLGERYEEGVGVARDEKRALDLYRRAASASGGTLWIYSPPVGKGSSGRVLPLDRGPLQPGLPEARRKLAELEARR